MKKPKLTSDEDSESIEIKKSNKMGLLKDDSKKLNMSGFLVLSGYMFRPKKKRFFSIENGTTLSCFDKNQGEKKADIDLTRTNIEMNEKKLSFKFFSNGRNWTLKTKTKKEYRNWMNSIKYCKEEWKNKLLEKDELIDRDLGKAPSSEESSDSSSSVNIKRLKNDVGQAKESSSASVDEKNDKSYEEDNNTVDTNSITNQSNLHGDKVLCEPISQYENKNNPNTLSEETKICDPLKKDKDIKPATKEHFKTEKEYYDFEYWQPSRIIDQKVIDQITKKNE